LNKNKFFPRKTKYKIDGRNPDRVALPACDCLLLISFNNNWLLFFMLPPRLKDVMFFNGFDPDRYWEQLMFVEHQSASGTKI